MSKQVQISEELFVRLCRMHLLGDSEQEAAIRSGLEAKLDAISRRADYTAYKTAESPQEREEARKRYLDRAGISEDWRW